MTSTFDDADIVARRSERFTALLAATDEAPRRVAFPSQRVAQATQRGRRVRRLAAAAAVTLVLAGTVGVPPVRAWIVSNAKALWSRISPSPAPVIPVAPAIAVRDTALVGAVSMAAGDLFAVQLASRQAAGTLVIERTDDTLASAAIVGSSNAELVVLPGGLRIVNAPDATSGYLVRVPRRVSRLTVTIARSPITRVNAGSMDRWTIDLRPSGR